MKHLADDKRSQPKEKIISIRVAEDPREVFHAAMSRLELLSLSGFARIAMLDLAERTLRPDDFTVAKLEREPADQKTRLRRRVQFLDLSIAAGRGNVDRHQVSDLIELGRRLLRTLESIEQRRL